MHEFSIGDGFVEISECLAEMIKYVANEPSVGLFYIQQHTQNAVPNLVRLKSNVVDKSHETALHTEDSEDSITMSRSMKECGSPIADEMIKDIKESLILMSSKQPKRGLIQIGRTSSWGPGNWGTTAYAQDDNDEDASGYFSTVMKSAKQKASNFKWPQLDPKELISYHNPSLPVEAASTSSTAADMEPDELPVSVQASDDEVDGKPGHGLLGVGENFDEFKADKEAKLEEWLEGTAKWEASGLGL